MAVFRPRTGINDEQVELLNELREIHREGFTKIEPSWTGADLVQYYSKTYLRHGITPLLGRTPDIGHTIHSGPKLQAKRLLLNASNLHHLADQFYAVEPAGRRKDKQGKHTLVGRFEECIYVPKYGKAILLGGTELAPIVI
jgi:hypothetical protein